MPFTEEEFKNEVLDKTLYGIISAFLDMPMVICDSEKAPDFFSFDESNKDQFMKDYSEFIIKMIDDTPTFKPRLIAIMEDMSDKGFIA